MRTSLVRAGLLLAFVASCSARTDVARDAIVHGSPSDGAQDYVVLLYQASAGTECTATLVAPAVVLTARHCVTKVASGDSIECGRDGEAVTGGQLGDDVPASELEIYVGATRGRPFPAPTARGTRVVHDGATNLCNHDLALLEIAPPVTSVAPARLNLDAAPSDAEAVTVIGWGVTDQQNLTRTRATRTGVDVLAVGPATFEGVDVPPNDFLLGESICDGDSGAPAFDGDGVVLGVASFGSNGTTASASDPASACVDAGSGIINTFTSLGPFASTIVQAFADTGAPPPAQSRITPRVMRWAGAD